ncbi:MAG: UDP-3-O-(3-hydroxymyristoyl)glucosamine N-acyltransferase [Aureispira sp.]|nr:UDP-3-O-(3-hydroxymyristoyl)glucosamine N-acyltransferase [Aureispira sp.]
MQVRAIDIANLLGGTVEGDENILVAKPAKIEEGEPGAISFFANSKYEEYVYTCKSSVILVANAFKPKQPVEATLVRVADVYSSLSILLEHFSEYSKKAPSGISAQAVIDSSANIGENTTVEALAYIGKNVILGKNVTVYPQAYIGDNVVIGDGSIIYAGVKIYKDTQIGQQCIIHAGAVLGSDGFGFAPQSDGSFKKIPQLGYVEIGNDVEIGANCTIDRATMDKTVIGDGVKIDNLVHIAHNVFIDKNTVMAAQVGIAGSTYIGKNCMLGGQAGLVGHLKIADGVKIQAQSGVGKSVKVPEAAIQGSPAIDYAKASRMYAVMRNLPELYKRINDLEKRVKQKDKNA